MSASLEISAVVASAIVSSISATLGDVVAPGVLRRWRWPTAVGPRTRSWSTRRAGRAKAHVVHALAHLSHLQLPHPLLKELNVPPALAHLGVELGLDGVVVGLLPHHIGGIDQSLLTLDLLIDGAKRLIVVIHGDSSASRVAETALFTVVVDSGMELAS